MLNQYVVVYEANSMKGLKGLLLLMILLMDFSSLEFLAPQSSRLVRQLRLKVFSVLFYLISNPKSTNSMVNIKVSHLAYFIKDEKNLSI